MKNMSGSVPINFKAVGEVCLFIGMIFVIIKAYDLFTGHSTISRTALIFGVGLVLVGAYLLLVVARKAAKSEDIEPEPEE